MKTILFAPAVFNLAETTRMIEVAKAMKDRYYCVFFGFSKTFAPLITESGFEYHLLAPILTKKQEEQIIKFDQLRTLKNPFTKEMFSFIHGGEGTVQTACESGKPFIGVGMQFEQSCNIDYCVKYGNAIALTKPVTERKLQIALREVSSPKIRQQARTLQAVFPINGPQQAIQEIETFLSNHPI
ncbi:hypothetical protein [Enterococcus faecium]|uniref:hypothetical protein n=1 Tax=Enterococcus faecium TaxID=1352 RepID=UPI00391A7842